MKMAQFFVQYKVPQITSTAILFQGLLQARQLVVDNYTCYQQLKNVVCEMGYRRLNAEFLVVDN